MRENLIIDSIFHPRFRESKQWIMIDAMMHAWIELSKGIPPREILRRFIKYSLPLLMR